MSLIGALVTLKLRSRWFRQEWYDGVIFGVMDVGFARHDSIIFLEFLPAPNQQITEITSLRSDAVGMGLSLVPMVYYPTALCAPGLATYSLPVQIVVSL